MPKYLELARKAHTMLIGQKENLGTREEDYHLEQGFKRSETEESSAPLKCLQCSLEDHWLLLWLLLCHKNCLEGLVATLHV